MNSDYLDKWDLWPFFYVYRVALAGPGNVGDTILRQGLPIQGDADFVLRATQMDYMNPAPSDLSEFIGVNPTSSFCQYPSTGGAHPIGWYAFQKKYYLPSDLAIQSTFTMTGAGNLEGLIPGNVSNEGNACYPIPQIPDVLLLRSTSMSIDLQNLTNLGVFAPPDSSLALEICFRGIKLIPKGSIFKVDRTKKYVALPGVYKAPLPDTTPGTYTKNALVTLESATQFLLYSVDCDAQNTGFQMTVYGARGERTSSLNVPGNRYGLVSRGNLLGTSRFPGVMCPPIEYPAGGNIAFDFYAPLNYTAQNPNAELIFRGVKLFQVG